MKPHRAVIELIASLERKDHALNIEEWAEELRALWPEEYCDPPARPEEEDVIGGTAMKVAALCKRRGLRQALWTAADQQRAAQGSVIHHWQRCRNGRTVRNGFRVNKLDE